MYQNKYTIKLQRKVSKDKWMKWEQRHVKISIKYEQVDLGIRIVLCIKNKVPISCSNICF